ASSSFNPGSSGVSQGDYSTVLGLVNQQLQGNRDPIDSILYLNGSYQLIQQIPPAATIDTVVPAQGPPGTEVALLGQGFAGSPGQEVVTFTTAAAAATASIYSTSATQLVAYVPNLAAGAATISVSIEGSPPGTASFTITSTGSADINGSFNP
ncbi:MAG: IPT/TIG domain-containing protein, partial [Cyanobacteria bacterium REEB65]|nr:IPT/TIG domain-containing protein [Cyanobacteria bacterium REEB65]